MVDFDKELAKNQANYQPLTPLSFLSRAADIYKEKTAIVYGSESFTYKQFDINARRLASALTKIGVKKGDTVSVMAPNIPAFLDANFGVPMTGAVLNALNIRLDSRAIAFNLDHGECDVLLTDTGFSETIKEALTLSSRNPLVVDIQDINIPEGERLGMDYNEFLSTGDPEFEWKSPDDEWDALALNYTSGTTGNPKGVVLSHRGAYLNSLGNLIAWQMTGKPIYLWTLPMFHCNGWCFPWSITALGGTQVCLRSVNPIEVIDSIYKNKVTHLCGAPIVLNMLINAPSESLHKIPKGLQVLTAGAPPPAAVIKSCEALGMIVTQTYGLTEVYGPCVVSEWDSAWGNLSANERASLKARQGVRYQTLEGLEVMNPSDMTRIPADGKTIGEIMFQGNTMMKGYLKNKKATAEAFSNGWFHSGDLAVKHPDGYIEIKDRSKDIIISGGENISSVEIEGVLYQHPAILEAAVVAKPDQKWGETPCAFVTLKAGMSITEQNVIEYCREKLANYKCPKTIIFSELPKTSTGKIQKHVLRDQLS